MNEPLQYFSGRISTPLMKRIALACAMALLISMALLLSTTLLVSETLAQPDESTPRGSNVLELPAPSGPNPLGCRLFHWVDGSRPEGATATEEDHRELFVRLWYPAIRPAEGEKRTPYFRQFEPYVAIFGKAKVDRLRSIQTHSVQDAPMIKSPTKFPVVLFSHGWQSQGAAYTALLEDLASHGYVVAAIDQPFQGRIAMADGSVTPATEAHFKDPMEIVTFYGQDQQFVLDRLSELNRPGEPFSGRLDLDRVANIGHSNGALAALQAAKVDGRFEATVALDSWDPAFESLFDLDAPLLLLRTGGAPEPSPEFRQSAEVSDVLIQDGQHLSASDWPFIEATDAAEREAAASVLNSIRQSLVGFFDTHLKRETATRLDSEGH